MLNPIEIHWARSPSLLARQSQSLSSDLFGLHFDTACLGCGGCSANSDSDGAGAGAGTRNEYGECGKWFNLECECECFTLHMPRA